MTLQIHGLWKGLIRFASVCQIMGCPATAQKTPHSWVENLPACTDTHTHHILYHNFYIVTTNFVILHLKSYSLFLPFSPAVYLIILSSWKLLILMWMSADLCSVVSFSGDILYHMNTHVRKWTMFHFSVKPSYPISTIILYEFPMW